MHTSTCPSPASGWQDGTLTQLVLFIWGSGKRRVQVKERAFLVWFHALQPFAGESLTTGWARWKGRSQELHVGRERESVSERVCVCTRAHVQGAQASGLSSAFLGELGWQ